eukprot:scaffold105528_cov69-Phaeocystis_antarctica.AAC.3
MHYCLTSGSEERLLLVLVLHDGLHHRVHQELEPPRRLIHGVAGADRRDNCDALDAVGNARGDDVGRALLQHRRSDVFRLSTERHDDAGDVFVRKHLVDVRLVGHVTRGDLKLVLERERSLALDVHLTHVVHGALPEMDQIGA